MWKKMYMILFNAITDAIRLLEKGNIWDAIKALKQAQCEAEEIYMSAEDSSEDNEDEIRILPKPEAEKTEEPKKNAPAAKASSPLDGDLTQLTEYLASVTLDELLEQNEFITPPYDDYEDDDEDYDD